MPEDLGIMGYGNMDMLKYISPKISSVEYDVRELGNMLFHTLYDLIKDDPGTERGRDIVLPYRFTEGESL